MNIYSSKQRWKVFLLVGALVIVGVTLWYSNYIASQIEQEEQEQVQLWSNAVKQRAELVEFTQDLFDQLRADETKKARFLASAFRIIGDVTSNQDLTFESDFIYEETSIPVLIYGDGEYQQGKNIDPSILNNPARRDSLKRAMERKNRPICFNISAQCVYYDESKLFKELQATMDDLINSFISETIINSASVPVILTDSSRTVAIRYNNVDTLAVSDSLALRNLLADMASTNDPIAVEIPDRGMNYIYFENSLILTQLKYFPVVQLVLVGLFLLLAYLMFSAFRNAEQNQVWVGMAKETAHQLGTPLSSLIAWSSLLEAEGVSPETLTEINKDINRLQTITDRFSKIGSKADLHPVDVTEVVTTAFDYLKVRVSTKVVFQVEGEVALANINKPLFGWVIENLVKNAVDAMSGEGDINAQIFREGDQVIVDLSDTGKGIPKGKQKTVFEPGFTTKKRGWGLGLSLTRRIVENYHEGKIFVKRSEPGKGTTFRIQLPAC